MTPQAPKKLERRPAHLGDVIKIVVTKKEIDMIIDAFDDTLEYAAITDNEEAAYVGLRKRWVNHASDFRKAEEAAT